MRYTLSTTDRTEAMRAMKSLDMALVLFELLGQLRSEYKYSANKTRAEYASELRDFLVEAMTDRGVDLDEILE